MVTSARWVLLGALVCGACGGGTVSGHHDGGGDAVVPGAGATEGPLPGDGPPGEGGPLPGDGPQRDSGPPPSGCAALLHESGVSVDGYQSDRYSWYDAACQLRTAALVRNDAADPGGSNGGFAREITYEVGGATRRCNAQAGTNWNGWGYVVNHYASTAATSRNVAGQYQTVYAGTHHAIHQFTLRMQPGGPVDTTIQWFFASGRSHPVYAITFDASPAGQDVVDADTRAPYGNLNFDGVTDSSGAVAGVGWGDQYKFTTTGAGPVTMETPWTYTEANTVPYVVMWAAAADGEMGLVQTQTFAQHVAGGDYGGGMLAACQSHTSASPGSGCTSGHVMPTDWLWPYQLNQYELPYGTTSKRLAWGATYGAVGQASYSAFGRTLSGYPRVSYSTYVVLGLHSEGTVAAQVAEVEAVQQTTFTATRGTVWATGPAGVGRNDTMTLQPAGWDPRYGTWNVAAAANQATVTFAAAGGALRHPVLVVSGYTATAVPTVTLDGAALTSDADFLASVDPAGARLWLTLLRDLSGSHTLAVE